AVDFDRPAAQDLQPRSALFRRIAPMAVPKDVNYYTFWGDIRVVVKRQLFAYDLPDFPLPSFGDLGLLPGVTDPHALPELGGQRFSPTDLGSGRVALDVPHRATIELTGGVIRDLIDTCGRKPTPDAP